MDPPIGTGDETMSAGTATGDAELLEQIRQIRARNNDLWMGLVGLALRYGGEEARAMLRGIVENDRKVAAATETLSQRAP
jgi:thioredoxin-like negative regulator of GroEL